MQYARRSAIEAAPMQEETILFDPEQNRFCVLNRTAALLWNQLDAPSTAEQLTMSLRTEYPELEPNRATADVVAAIAELQELSLVVAVPQP